MGNGPSGTAEQAKDRAKDVAATAREGGAEALSEAKGQAGEVVQQAKAQARNVADDLKRDAHEHASRQTERAAEGLRGLAQQVSALVEGRPGEAGMAGDYARRLQQRVSDIAERMEHGGFDGVVQDARRLARRRPGTFLLGAAVLGFATGRMLRAGAQAQHEDGNGSSELAAGQRAPVAPLTRPAVPTPAVSPVEPVLAPAAPIPPVGAVPPVPPSGRYPTETDR